MKFILKSFALCAIAIFISAVMLWCLSEVPLWRQIIKTMEITTGYHLTFLDYLKTSALTSLACVTVKVMTMLFKGLLEDSVND